VIYDLWAKQTDFLAILKCPEYLPELLLTFTLDIISVFFGFASYETFWQASLKVKLVSSEPLVLQSWNTLLSQQFSQIMTLSFNLSPQQPSWF